MRFVLTGRAVINGEFADRSHLIARCRVAGHAVCDSFMQGADILVASRSNTRKAEEARALGKPVWTYDQFNGFLLTGRNPYELDRSRANQIVERLFHETRQASHQQRDVPPKTVEPHPMPKDHMLSRVRRAIDL